MVRVYCPMFFALVLLSACSAREETPPPAASTEPAAAAVSAPSQETLAGCAYKTSVVAAWSCATKDKSTP